MPTDQGNIVTVEGRIDPDELGTTLTHEHTFIDMTNWRQEPDTPYERKLSNEPVTLENLHEIRRLPMLNTDNLLLGSLDEAIDEVSKYHRAGGDSIVDVTPKGPPGQDPRRVREVGRETGVQFIQGTAYYVESGHPDSLAERSGEEIEEEFVDDVINGIDDTDIRAGIVGEIGLSTDDDGEVFDEEIKVLRAGARAARRTGASLTIHPPGRRKAAQRGRTYPPSRWALDVLDVVEEEGLPPERVVMDHMDRTLFEDIDYLKELASRGPYLEFDLFGSEFYYDQWDDGYPSDKWRIDTVCELIDEGHIDQILLSHDVCVKIQRTKYGGAGYAHVLNNVVPMFEEHGGLSDDQIHQMVAENPKEMLTFVEPER